MKTIVTLPDRYSEVNQHELSEKRYHDNHASLNDSVRPAKEKLRKITII